MKKTKMLAALAALAVFVGSAAHAQEQPDLRKMAQGMKRNQEELRLYTWDTKIVFQSHLCTSCGPQFRTRQFGAFRGCLFGSRRDAHRVRK